MASNLASLVVDLQVNTAELRKGLDEATAKVSSFGERVGEIAEALGVFEAVKVAMEGVAKAAEFMDQGIKDAASLGNAPARELGETLEHVGLATRQLGADLASNLAPAFNALLEYFTGGVNWGKLLADVAGFIGDAFRALVKPIVLVAGAIKGLVEGGDLKSALKGAADAAEALAKHGASFAGSLKTAGEQARAIAGIQQLTANYGIAQEGKRLENQFQNLTGNRREDRFAGATQGFADFDDALATWKKNMYDASEFTRKAAVEDSYGSKIAAAAFQQQAQLAVDVAEKAKLAAEGFRVVKEKLIQDTQEIKNIKFNLAEAVEKNARNVTVRTRDFQNIGDPSAELRDVTAGFKDFHEALEKQAAALNNQAGLIAAADIIEKEHGAAAQDTVLALKKQAEEYGEAAAVAGKATEGFKKLAEIQAQAADLLKQKVLNGIEQTVGAFTNKMGDFGTVVNEGIQGFKSGGVWGAIIAVVADLISRIKDWSQILDIGNGLIQGALADLAGAFSSIITGLKPLLGALGRVFHSINGVLAPILELIGNLLGGISPLFEILGMVLEPLGGIFKSIAGVLDVVLKPVLFVIVGIFEGIGEVMLGFQLAVNAIWLALVTAADEILKAFGNHSLSGARDDANKGLKATIAQMDALSKMDPNKLKAQADADADAAGKLGKSADGAAKALDKMTASLTNVPQGFKIAAARYGATAADVAGGSVLGGKAGGPGWSAPINVTVQGSVISEGDLVKFIQTQFDKNSFRKGGI